MSRMDVLLLSVVCLSLALPVHSIEWMSTPGVLRPCVDEDVKFLWNYDVTSTPPVTFVQWQFITKSVTVLQKQIRTNGNVSLTYYDYGPDRVSLTSSSEANAGIVLKAVQKTDSGRYIIRVSGGITNEAELQVYDESDLEPSLEINNSPVEFGSVYNMSDCTRCVIVISTALSLPADISSNISSKSTTCVSKSTCSRLINLSGLEKGSNRITFKIDYGICSVKEKYIDLYWDGEGTAAFPGEDKEQWSPGNGDSGGLTSKWEFILGLTLGVLVVIIIVMCVVMIMLVKWVKRKQKKEESCNNLSRRQQGLVNAVNKWRSAASTARKPIKRLMSRTPDVVIETPESVAMVRTVEGASGKDDFPDRNDPEGKDVESSSGDIESKDKIAELETISDRVQGEGESQKHKIKRLKSTDSSMLKDYVVVPKSV